MSEDVSLSMLPNQAQAPPLDNYTARLPQLNAEISARRLVERKT